MLCALRGHADWIPHHIITCLFTKIRGSRGLVVKVLDSKFEVCEFKTHIGHGSFSKLRQFRLPYFASVYSAANEYKHCLEGTCSYTDSPVQESQYNCTLSCFATRFKHWPYKPSWLLKA